MALHRLYQRTHRVVFTLIMRIVGDRTIAEELTVEVFQNVWQRASQFDAARETVLGWIMNQTRCHVIEVLRQRRVADSSHERAREEEHSAESSSEALAVARAVTELTAEERQMIEALFFSEMGHEALVAKLQQSPPSLRHSVRSALLKLGRVERGEQE